MKKKRGLVYLEADIGRLFLPDLHIKGGYEVIILEETENYYRIRFEDRLLRRCRYIPEWIMRSKCKIIES